MTWKCYNFRWQLMASLAVIGCATCLDVQAQTQEPQPDFIIRVDDDATSNGTGENPNWSDAYDNLPDALVRAHTLADEEPGAIIEVRIAGGRYEPPPDPSGTAQELATLMITRPMSVRGGFKGLSVSNASERDDQDLENIETVLDGDIGQTGSGPCNPPTEHDNAWHVVTIKGVGPGSAVRLCWKV